MSSELTRMQKNRIENDIHLIEDALAGYSENELIDVHRTIDGKYREMFPNWGKGMYAYSPEYGFAYENIDARHNLKIMKGQLEGLVDRGEYTLLGERGSKVDISPNINTNITNTNIQNNIFEVTREEIENNGFISSEERAEILEKINHIEQVINSPDTKITKWETLKPILTWLSDKGVDVALKILPLLLGM